MSGFFVYKRGDIFYARLKNPKTNRWMTARSTRVRDRKKAEYLAQKWLYEGIPIDKEYFRTSIEVFTVDEILNRTKQIELQAEDVKRFLSYFKSKGFIENESLKPENEESLIDFLTRFWDWDESEYIKEKLSYGQSITRNYAKDMSRRLVRYWKPYFKDTPLSSITSLSLKQFATHLSNLSKVNKKGEETGEPLAAQSKNHILKVGQTAFSWATDNGIIPVNPAANLRKFSLKRKERGILTDEEVKKLFSIEWIGSPANRLANLTASQTGLRLGELVALRVEDIKEDRIVVSHSWSEMDGLKPTKTNESREVPILTDLRTELLNYAHRNPNGYDSTSFIFWAKDRYEAPCRSQALSESFIRTLHDMGLQEKEIKGRGLCFHSWRHYYSTKMAEALAEDAMKLTGHKTAAVFEAYSGHQTEKQMEIASQATREAFSHIIPFSREAAV